MEFQTFWEMVEARCRELGIDRYEVYYQTAESTSVSVYQHEINQFSASLEGGVCLRLVSGGKMGYASTEQISEEAARLLVERALDNAAALETEEPVYLCEGGKEYAQLPQAGEQLPATDGLIRRVLSTQEQLYAAHPAVIDGCTTQGIAEQSVTAIRNSLGLNLRRNNTLTGLVVAAVVSDGKEMSNDYQIALGALDTIDTAALTGKAVRTALEKLGGEPAPTGKYPVVFDPEAMTDLLSTFSPVFSAENARKGLSRLSEKEGTAVAASPVTLVDDPFHPGSPNRSNFDAEGCPTFRKEIISGGRLNTLLHNLKTAALAGCQTTGNAAKARFDSPVDISPFTLYLAPGEKRREQLIAEAGNGVYIQSLGGLHAGANPVSGDFSLQSAGWLIEDGKLTSRVKAFTVAGNFYELLKQITGIASDLEFPGMGTVGSPTVLVDGLSIAGK